MNGARDRQIGRVGERAASVFRLEHLDHGELAGIAVGNITSAIIVKHHDGEWRTEVGYVGRLRVQVEVMARLDVARQLAGR